MASFDVKSVLTSNLPNFENDLLEYIISAIEEMPDNDKKSLNILKELIIPFLLDTNYINDEEEGVNICKSISVAFGGSGYKGIGKSNNTTNEIDNDTPVLLSAPVKMVDHTKTTKTYGATFMATSQVEGGSSIAPVLNINSNTKLDVNNIPTTQKQMRKLKKENEQLKKILQLEEEERQREASEVAKARMAAIKASRALGRQALTGVNIDKFSLPHPSGKGDLLTDASLILSPGRRYGLIGRNGAGKSTLLRALSRYELNGLMHLRIMLVDQHIEGNENSPLEWVLSADIERTSLLNDEKLLSTYLYHTTNEPLPEALIGVNIELALQEVYERMDVIGVGTAEKRARKILQGLGFTSAMMEKPTNKLSGGWAMRAALAAAVFVKPNLLLLDEPTNHLDLHALVWLEHWLLNDFTGILVVVSHDKYFLTNICTDILELRSQLAGQKSNTLTHFTMDYLSYEVELNDRKIVQQRAKLAYEKEKEKLKEFISREGRKYDNPSHQSQRKMKMKQLENLIEVEEVEEETELHITLPKPYGYFDESTNLIYFDNVSYHFNNEPDLFQNINLRIGPLSRICILGKNGSGKTTILQLIMDEIEPTSGNIIKHVGCRIAMLQQHHYKGEQLDPNLNALDHLRRLPMDDSTAVGVYDIGTRQEETAHRSYLANFGIQGWRATINIKNLSGGQRMRVALAVALYRRPDIIILDEPTNHLDRDTVRALAEALESYQGAIIVVSHDEDFVNNILNTKKDSKEININSQLWVLSKQQLQIFDGTFHDYKQLVMKKVINSLNDD